MFLAQRLEAGEDWRVCSGQAGAAGGQRTLSPRARIFFEKEERIRRPVSCSRENTPSLGRSYIRKRKQTDPISF